MWKMTIAFTLLEQTCLTKQANKTLPPHTNAVKIANDMGDYFVQKITAIRSKMAASTQSPPPSAAQESDYITTLEMADLSFSELALLTEGDVKNLALACKKSCDLDPLPSSILSIHLDHLLPVITKMINLSPKTGRFADEWKNALVHPLLKKSGLEPVNKNFRPISIYSLLLSFTDPYADQWLVPGNAECVS